MMEGNEWADLAKVNDVTASATAEVKRLAGLDPIAYETERKDAAARLGCRASVLDAAVQKVRTSGAGDVGEDANSNAARIEEIQSEPPDCSDDRRRDNWTPLHRIAAVLCGAWPDRIASAYAAKSQAQDEDTEPGGVMMLGDLAEIFASRQDDRIASSELVGDLRQLEDRPWAEWSHGKPLTPQSVARLLKPFGVKPRVMNLNGSSTRGYFRADVEAAAGRYIPQTRNLVTQEQNQDVSGSSDRNLGPLVTPINPNKPLKDIEGYRVTPATTPEVSSDKLEPESWT